MAFVRFDIFYLDFWDLLLGNEAEYRFLVNYIIQEKKETNNHSKPIKYIYLELVLATVAKDYHPPLPRQRPHPLAGAKPY